MELRVQLLYPDKHGATELDHLVQVGAEVPDIVVPDELVQVWRWFWSLSAARGGGMGPAPLSYGEIDAWRRLMAVEVRPDEIALIRDMDAAYLGALPKNRG